MPDNDAKIYTLSEIAKYVGLTEERAERICSRIALKFKLEGFGEEKTIISEGYSFKNLIEFHAVTAFLPFAETTPELISELMDILWTNEPIPHGHYEQKYSMPYPVSALYETAVYEAFRRIEYMNGVPVEFHPYCPPFDDFPSSSNLIAINPVRNNGKSYLNSYYAGCTSTKAIADMYESGYRLEEIDVALNLPRHSVKSALVFELGKSRIENDSIS